MIDEPTLRVLIVEDDQDIRELLVELLRDELAIETREAPDGQAGLRLARGEPFALVLLDLGLPDMDGLDVARALKSDRATRHLPIVALTARFRSDEAAAHARAAGCDASVVKPFDVDELLATLRSLLPE